MSVIAIDGRKYFDFGIGTYIQQLVKALSLLKTQHEFLLYASPSDMDSILLPSGWSIAGVEYGKYSLSEIGMFGFRAKRDQVGVFHEPHYTLPVGIKDISVVTIHDIIHLRFPRLFSRIQRAYSSSMIWHCLRNSRMVIADSEFTKHDILSTFRLREDKIKVIHLGVGGQYKPITQRSRIEEFRKRHGIERPFILYVGNVKPHKGIDVLLTAFKTLRVEEDVDLVLVGGSIRFDPILGSMARDTGVEDRIKELGRLNDDDLVTAYSAAEVLVMPSRYEGFGLPALEAMACGTPVVVSNAASLPEIVGDAAVIFHVDRSQELADDVSRLMRESTLRKEMIEKGLKQVKKFTWHDAAEQTLNLYEEIIGQ